MRTDSMEKTEQTVYVLNGITLLPHYTLPCFVAPGFTNYTPMKLWTANELLEEGAVEQDPQTRKYLIGQEVSLLALARTARTPVRAVAEPYLHHIAEKAGDTVFLTIRSGFDSICVDRRTGNYPVKVLSIEIGARRPLGLGVGGLVLLAFLPRAESAAITKANAQRLAHHGLTTTKLTERVRATRAQGYAYTEVGVVRGTKALAEASQ